MVLGKDKRQCDLLFHLHPSISNVCVRVCVCVYEWYGENGNYFQPSVLYYTYNFSPEQVDAC